MSEFLLILSLTILLEFIIHIFLFKKGNGFLEVIKIFSYSIIVNSITNPLANFTYKYVFNSNIFSFICIEFFVISIEIFIIKVLFRVDIKKAVLASILANSVTILISFLL